VKWPVTLTIAAALVCSIGVAMYFWPTKPAAPSKPLLSDIPTERMQIEVVTFQPEAKKRMRLPKPVQANPDKHVTAATRIEVNEDRPVEVTAVLDEQTGETTLFEREVERPWIGFKGRTEAGAYLGMIDTGEQAIRLQARHEFAKVKGLRIGVMGTADMTQSGMRHFVGIGVWGQW